MTQSLNLVVIGAAGRLGAVMTTGLAAAGHRVTGLTRDDLDLADPDRVAASIKRLRPDVIVNCAAYNAVDAAEDDPAAAFAVNAWAPRVLALAAGAIDALLVHYSSDFVFDGDATEPYTEDHAANPRSVYGASKLQGEVEARNAPRHYILRVESLFGGTGVRGHLPTIDQITDGIVAGKVVRALVDRTVSPSYVPDVVSATRGLIEHSAPCGTYHCVNSGRVTWFDLAHQVAHQIGIRPQVEPVNAVDFKSRAQRPRFCALSNRKLRAVGIVMPTWQSAVDRHLAARRT